ATAGVEEEEPEVGACDTQSEYAARICSAPRAQRTCSLSRLPPSLASKGKWTRCSWHDRCMRCVPPVGYVNDTTGTGGCAVDGVSFRSSGACPAAVDMRVCGGCDGMYLQEVCLGLCS
ncbi:unnamed protein product, partial [Polarella glacialis]